MDVQEAYRVMQEHCGIEKGDTAKMVRLPFRGDIPFGRYDPSFYSCGLGRQVTITEITERAVFSSGTQGGLPFYCFELVEKAKPELPPIKIGNHVIEFLPKKGNIKVCGIIIHQETLEQILERLKK